MLPGPSDWDIQIAAKVSKTDLDSWVGTLSPVKEMDLTWLTQFKNLKTTTRAELYGMENDSCVIYREAGWVFRRLRSQ